MADSNILKRFLDAGVAFTELTQARAEAIVKDLVAAGEVQTSQAQTAVSELLQRSRENTERLLDQVRGEIRSQLDSMGLATKVDVSRLERRIAGLGGRRPATPPSTPAPRASTPVKKTAAKRASAKKTTTAAAAKKAAKVAGKKATKRAPAKAAAKKR